MRSTRIGFAIVGFAAICAGCNSSTETATDSAVKAAVPSDPVARVVYDFLDAMRTGNVAEASKRLTPMALQLTDEMNMAICPPASETAQFELDEVKVVGTGLAMVSCTWSDRDVDGNVVSELMAWGLKNEDGMWRISGMVPFSEDGAPGEPVDFESRESMQRLLGGGSPAQVGPPAGNPNAPLPTDKVARDPFQQATQR